MLSYQELLNASQYRVVSAGAGPMLVIAGAGTGKTRTIVYRLAWLIEHGAAPWNILLLTFTRKAAKEMLDRAQVLLNGDLRGLTGGTFHSLAYRLLRQYKPDWLEGHSFTVMDATDQQDMLKRIKDEKNIGKGVKGFPKIQAIMGYISKARNKETELADVVRKEAQHLAGFTGELEEMQEAYSQSKRDACVLDYDDLLFELEDLLKNNAEVRRILQEQYQHILVDEYQDTNLVQARLIRLLAGDLQDGRTVMAVGDEAQSIYSFRGATVRNILDFPDLFPGSKVIALEKNYRSVQSVLDVANKIMSCSDESYAKKLEAVREEDLAVHTVKCGTDYDQGKFVARFIASQIKDKGRKPSEFAVLFRVGHQSFQTEGELTALGIPYRKYGGLRYQESSHVKDFLAYLNFIVNPDNELAFARLACMHDKVGVKTAKKMFAALNDGTARSRMEKKYPGFFEELKQLESLRERQDAMAVQDTMSQVMDLYEPHFEELYPDDYPVRKHGLEELHAMAQGMEILDLFLAEMQLDSVDKKEDDEEVVTLSTIHSAKGLEWDTVIVLDLVDGRFPSRFADIRKDIMEEERRLMYVACTRAMNSLYLCYYKACSQYGQGLEYCDPSNFLDEIFDISAVSRCVGDSSGHLYCSGQGAKGSKPAAAQAKNAGTRTDEKAGKEPFTDSFADSSRFAKQSPATEGSARTGESGQFVPASSCLAAIRRGSIKKCRHRIFGEGDILGYEEPDKLAVRFPAHGKKVIVASYLFVQDKSGQ